MHALSRPCHLTLPLLSRKSNDRLGSSGKLAVSGELKIGDLGEDRDECPDGRPRRMYASSEPTRVRVRERADDETETVIVHARLGVWRIMRALPSRIKAISSSSRLSGRAGRGGGGPDGLVNGIFDGLNVVGSCAICVDDTGREIATTLPELDREEHAERTESKGRNVRRRGFGVGVSTGIWGRGGGGGSWPPAFVRKM